MRRRSENLARIPSEAGTTINPYRGLFPPQFLLNVTNGILALDSAKKTPLLVGRSVDRITPIVGLESIQDGELGTATLGILQANRLAIPKPVGRPVPIPAGPNRGSVLQRRRRRLVACREEVFQF